MKTTKMHSIVCYLISFFAMVSCIEDGAFSIPDSIVVEPNIVANSSISAVKAALKQEFITNNNLTYTFREGDELYLEGYVISSDAAGNFYKKLVLQDLPENPTAGIEILLNKTSLSETYDLGRKIYLLLDGLSVAYDDGAFDADPTNTTAGKYILGSLDGQRVSNIPSTVVEQHLVRSGTVTEIVPQIIALSTITEAHISTQIQLSTTQFIKADLGKTFAGEANDQFDGFRKLIECESDKIIKLQTSTFASFKSNVVPTGKGTATLVLSKDYTSAFLVGIANTPANLVFTNPERCDPIVLDCGLAASEGTTVLFFEDFENQLSSSFISGNGWTHFIAAGSEGWEAYTATGSNPSQGVSARVGAYNSNDNSTVSWLITPKIDLNNNTGITLQFQTSNSYADDSSLALLFSNDWDGTTSGIDTATWGDVPRAYITQNTDAFSNWYDSGLVDLSCGEGSTYFAFRYTGSGNTNEDGTYELDNIIISAN